MYEITTVLLLSFVAIFMRSTLTILQLRLVQDLHGAPDYWWLFGREKDEIGVFFKAMLGSSYFLSAYKQYFCATSFSFNSSINSPLIMYSFDRYNSRER